MDNETKQMFELIINKLDKVETRLDKMETRLDKMDGRFDKIDDKFNEFEGGFGGMESRQDEIFQIVKAIEHSNQVHKAEIDNMNFLIAHVEGTIQGVGEYIIGRRAVK